jgi:hypothetical protein
MAFIQTFVTAVTVGNDLTLALIRTLFEDLRLVGFTVLALYFLSRVAKHLH